MDKEIKTICNRVEGTSNQSSIFPIFFLKILSHSSNVVICLSVTLPSFFRNHTSFPHGFIEKDDVKGDKVNLDFFIFF
jgi:hypothetical protein